MRVESTRAIRDITVACVDAAHADGVVGPVRALDGITVDSVSDRTFLMHKGGKIEVRLHADYIVPSVFNRRVAEAVAEAVANAAVLTRVARRTRDSVADAAALPTLG